MYTNFRSPQQCHVRANTEDTSPRIECYNLPSFKTDIYGNVYYCVHCKTAFYNSRTVKNHLGTVHNDFQYFCEYCGEFFSIDWQLKRHQNLYTYNCDHCEYSTNHYSQFRDHSSRVHKIEMKPKFRSENRYNKIYECDICGYQVLRPHMFKKHMRTIHETDIE